MVKIENETQLLAVIKDVHSDSSETSWVLAGHVENNPELIRLTASGSGAVDQLFSHFDETAVQYGLLRVSQKIDLSTTVKFVYIYFIGEQVPALARGKIGTAHGEIKKLFSPYHIDFEITNPSEISLDSILSKIDENSGKVDKVREVSHDGSVHERGFTSSSTKSSSGNKASHNFQGGASGDWEADQAVIDAVADVRNDKTETNWVLAAYADNDTKKPLVLVATGNGGVDELASNLTPELIAYGLIRVIDVIEGIKTVKFVFITFIGPDVSVMKKAKVSTNKGGVVGRFSPFHVTLEVSSTNELSDEILLTLVQEASGSKSKVK